MTCDHLLAQTVKVGEPCPVCGTRRRHKQRTTVAAFAAGRASVLSAKPAPVIVSAAPQPRLSPFADRARVMRALDRNICRASFADFLRAAWPVIEPSRPFIPNVASEAICEHLQAIADGKIRRLLVAMPPGIGKSTLVSVAYPAWRLARNPAWRIICASHAHDLAVELSRRTRRLIESAWYRDTFGITLRDDQNRSDNFATTKDGRRIAVGVDGALTGFRGNEFIVDDSLNAIDATSKAIREHANKWFRDAAYSRLDDADTAPMTVVQQCLDVDDLIGHLRAIGGWEYLCLPAEFQVERRSTTSIGWKDPRTIEGEPLAPALQSPAYLAEQKKVMTTRVYNCQYQQDPSPTGGGMIKREWYRYWRAPDVPDASATRPRGCSAIPAKVLPKARDFDLVVIAADLAFKKTATSDYNVITALARKDASFYLLEQWRARAEFPEVLVAFKAMAGRWPAAKKTIEAAASGHALLQTLQSEIPGLLGVPPQGDKVQRLSAVLHFVEAGNLYLPEDWNGLDDYLAESDAFPNGRHDDQIDTISLGLSQAMAGDGFFREGLW